MPYSEIPSACAISAAVMPPRLAYSFVENAEATHGQRRLKNHGTEGNPLRIRLGFDGRFGVRLFVEHESVNKNNELWSIRRLRARSGF